MLPAFDLFNSIAGFTHEKIRFLADNLQIKLVNQKRKCSRFNDNGENNQASFMIQSQIEKRFMEFHLEINTSS